MHRHHKRHQGKSPRNRNLEWYMENFYRLCGCGKRIVIHAYRPKGKFSQRISGACWNHTCSLYGKEVYF